MKNLFYNPLSLIFLFALTSISYSQERTVTGLVTTLENIVVVNAEVKVFSSKVTVMTDSMGNFKVSCLFKDKIKVSANGFYSQKVKIDEKTNKAFINLKFKPGNNNLDIALGNGHIKEKDKPFAVSSIRNDDKFNFSRYSNMYELIANSSPSVVLQGKNILIRGSNSLLGSSTALIIINGVVVNSSQLSIISPLEVKSVDILKGGSTAIYGSRGANGVVIITTKGRGDDD